MASYYDRYTEQLAEQVQAWKDKNDEIKAEIATQEQRVQDFQEMIDEDMAQGDATDETAKNSLNLQYAQKRLKNANAELAKHEMTPLYTLDEYDKACRQIVADLKPKEIDYREAMQKAVEDCLHVLDALDDLGRDANRCQSALKQACRDCGEDIETELKGSHYYSGLRNSVTPAFMQDFRKELEHMEMRLKQ